MLTPRHNYLLLDARRAVGYAVNRNISNLNVSVAWRDLVNVIGDIYCLPIKDHEMSSVLDLARRGYP